MNYLLLPDLAAMAMLLGILYFLRRRHPGETVDLWLVGLVFIFFEAIIHAAYPAEGLWHLVAHVAALNFFFVAGAIFLWASGRDVFPRKALRYSSSTLCRRGPADRLRPRCPQIPASIEGIAAAGFFSVSLVRLLSREGGIWAEGGGHSSVQFCTWTADLVPRL